MPVVRHIGRSFIFRSHLRNCLDSYLPKMYQTGTSGFVSVMQSGEVFTVDFRSDTVTKPNSEMRKAMMDSVVGDDVYGEDPTVNELQSLGAKLLGKEAGLYVPSGTMSNLIALLVHCKFRGSEAIVGDESHILHYEQTGAAQFGGINLRPVKTYEDGTLDLEEIRGKLRNSKDIHQSISALLCVENTHNRRGGRVLPLNWIEKVGIFAKEYNMKLHLDGARIFNASAAMEVDVSELVKPFDTVSICLSKSLGAPVGSILVGSSDFIEEARRCRKALGGGMRQAGVIAAAGLVALTKGPARLVEDHRYVKHLATKVNEMGSGLVEIDLATVETNMAMLKLSPSSKLTPDLLVRRMAQSTEKEIRELGEDIRVLAYPMTSTSVRVVVHCDITPEDIERAIKKFKFVFEEYRKNQK